MSQIRNTDWKKILAKSETVLLQAQSFWRLKVFYEIKLHTFWPFLLALLFTKLETFCYKPGLCGDLKLPGLNGLEVIWLGTIPWGSNMLRQDCTLELMLTTNLCWLQGKMQIWPILVFTFGKFLFLFII